MKQIRIVLYPDKSQAEATIESGFVEELAEYVRNVRWLHWKTGNNRKKRQIVISGFAKKDSETAYLNRVQVFGQRMIQCGVDVFIRNKSEKAWISFDNPCLSEDQLLEFELEKISDISSKEYWAMQDIRVDTELLQKAEVDNNNRIDFLTNRINRAQATVDEEQEFEKNRVISLKSLWDKYKEKEDKNEAEILNSFDYYL